MARHSVRIRVITHVLQDAGFMTRHIVCTRVITHVLQDLGPIVSF